MMTMSDSRKSSVDETIITAHICEQLRNFNFEMHPYIIQTKEKKDCAIYTHNHQSVELILIFGTDEKNEMPGKLLQIKIIPPEVSHYSEVNPSVRVVSLAFTGGIIAYGRDNRIAQIPQSRELTDLGININAITAFLNSCCRENVHDYEHFRFVLCGVFSALKKTLVHEKMHVRSRKVAAICRYLHQNYKRGDLSIAEVAKVVNLSPNYLQRIFSKDLHCTPKEYLLQIRLIMARNLLSQQRYMIKEVAEMCGWNSANYFSNCYFKYFGHYPSQDE